MDSISYTQMLSMWKKGSRNGVIRRLPVLQRGLFRAALEYARMKGSIVNQRLVGIVRGLAEKLYTLGQRIFNRGMERAGAILRNAKMAIFPVRRWIACDSYVFWLGTDLLFRHRSWITFSYR